MEKAVYIHKNGAWKNANDNLDIRGITGAGNTINGTPTRETVPKVMAYTSSGWDQIYPAKIVNAGKQTIVADRLDYYQYCRTDNVNWGWNGNAAAGQGYFDQDLYDQTGFDDMSLIKKEYMGWVGLGSDKRNKLVRASEVKDITFLQFKVYRRTMTGHTGLNIDWCLVLNTCDGPPPKRKPGEPRVLVPNPFDGRIGEHVVAGTFPPGEGIKIITVDLKSANGRATAEMVKRWMRGEGNSIMMYNNERKANNRNWIYDDINYGRWSPNYTKITSLEMTIDYTI